MAPDPGLGEDSRGPIPGYFFACPECSEADHRDCWDYVRNQALDFSAGVDLTAAIEAGVGLADVVTKLRAWGDMIHNCADVPQNPDSLPQMLLHDIRGLLSHFQGASNE